MTFLSAENRDRVSINGLNLSQRARAGVEFLGEVQKYSSSVIRSKARQDFTSDPDAKELTENWSDPSSNEPWDIKIKRGREIAERSPNYLFERLFQRYVAEEVYLRAIPATEECREDILEYLKDEGPDVGGSLELDKTLHIPDYYDGTEWHLAPDGWDGYDLYGPLFTFVAMPYIYKHGGYAAVEAGDNIIEQRKSFVAQLPKSNYKRIYEVGCGGIATLSCAHERFPDAELVGCDLSPLLLRIGHITANRLGIPVSFKQRNADNTGEPDNSVDAVLNYAVLHELPVDVGKEVIKESFRMLRPGGDMVISDPPPFHGISPFQSVVLDWDTENRGEPFFTATREVDWCEVMRDAGFENVEAYSLGKHGYPWINRGQKPG